MAYQLGLDKSGNSNNFTVTNLVITDQVLDSPTNNFATWSPIHNGDTGTFAEGNLKLTTGSGTTEGHYSTIAVQSGKWYAEFLVGAAGTQNMYGIASNVYNNSGTGFRGGTQYSYALGQGAIWANGGESSSLTTTFAVGDIFSVAMDLDNNDWYVARNNTYYSSGNPSAGSNGIGIEANNTYHFSWTYDHDGAVGISTANFGQDSSFAAVKTAQGNQDGNGIGDFFYPVPTGYLALCSENLPEPAVDPKNHFNTILYNGTGGGVAVRTVGFQPDLIWGKKRNATQQHWLIDSVRGAGVQLSSNNDETEGTEANGTAFVSIGFDTSSNDLFTTNNHNYVVWNWKAGNANTTFSESGNNPAGTHRANVAAGFSIVSYTGTGAAGTVAHGLGAAPEIMIIKNRDAADSWAVYYGDNTNYFALDTTAAEADSDTYWNDTSPTATVFTVNTAHNVNADGEKYIAYCWRSIDGFSKIGTYTGNGNADGVFIYTGFRPAWVLMKRLNNGDQGTPIFDSVRNTSNVTNLRLKADATAAEINSDGNIDLLSNGFKARNTDGSINTNGGAYVYMAFAESSFKYSNAR